MYHNNNYILVDGEKQAYAKPTYGVKQGYPLSPLLFSIYLNEVNEISEGIEGACTGAPNFHVSNLLYADDLCLTSNSPNNLQARLNRLKACARRKFLTVNTKNLLTSVLNPRPITCLPFLMTVRSCLTQIPSATWGCSLTTCVEHINLHNAAEEAPKPCLA
eukprot:1149523-Pelagomonas_calceolata.AAC.1